MRRDKGDTRVTRHVTRRDARLEGEPDAEPSARDGAAPAKERQRDLTSLSGPVPDAESGNEREG